MKGYKELRKIAREKFLADIAKTYKTFYERLAAIEFVREASNDMRRAEREDVKV